MAVEIVEATLPKLPAPVAAMVRLQLLTGMRAGEVMVMRGMDLNTSGPTWVYTPHRHKNQYRGLERVIYLGPQAQEAIKPFLRSKVEAYLFSPRLHRGVASAAHGDADEQATAEPTGPEAEAAPQAPTRRTLRAAQLPSSHRPGLPSGGRAAVVAATTASHGGDTVASEVRRRGRQGHPGHTRVETTQIYAERDLDDQEIMREIG